MEQLEKSVVSDSEKSQETLNIEDDAVPPPDKFFFVRSTVILLGITSLLISSFVISAHDYWMYKFRDPAMGTSYNDSNKTSLQNGFATSLGYDMSAPSMLGLVFGLTFGQRIKSRKRINACYGLIICFYIQTTMFVKVDTDYWQPEFLVMSLVVIGFQSLVFTILLSALIETVPKLPPNYLKYFLYGQGISGIFSVLLQIMCMLIGNDSVNTALIYFSSGTFLFILTIVMYHFTQYTPLFDRYLNDELEVTTMEFPKWTEIKRIIQKLWAVILINALLIFSASITHTTITGLIVSENYGVTTDWTGKYFVPVVTVLYGNVVGLIGRIFGSAKITKENAMWYVWINIIRVVIFPPLFICCNLRNSPLHTKPLFRYDWEYMVILGIYTFTQGYFNTSTMLSIVNFTKPDEPLELYYVLLTVILTSCGIVFSPLGIFLMWVENSPLMVHALDKSSNDLSDEVYPFA